MNGPNLTLVGRVALITGCGRGIGLAMARAMASAGCAVAVQDIELDVAEAEAEKLRSEGGKAVALGGDISDVTLPRNLVEQTRRQFSGLHILINNAAIQADRRWTEYTVEQIDHEWRANLIGPFLLCQEVAAGFRAQQWGRIINMGSVQGRSGNPGMLPYSMSKAGLENLTKALARDMARDGVTVNMISPGWFNTWRNRGDFASVEEMAQKGRWVPMGRIGQPSDAAGLALLLCSEAGSYITGQNIYVDGGITSR